MPVNSSMNANIVKKSFAQRMVIAVCIVHMERFPVLQFNKSAIVVDHLIPNSIWKNIFSNVPIAGRKYQCYWILLYAINYIYIEDCEVCCNPIEVNPVFENAELISFEVRNIEQ